MRYETYEFESRDSRITFEFISEGPRGSIKKRVHYDKIDGRKFYNLAFGDVNPVTDDFDDTIVSNNGDMEKVLATIAATIYAFLDEYPEARIYLEGSTHTRTRLYRIGISNNFEEISKDLKIYGLSETRKWMAYEKDGNYSAFLIIKK